MVNNDVTLWEVSIRCLPGRPDAEHLRLLGELESLAHASETFFSVGIPDFGAERGYLISGALNRPQIERICEDLLVDPLIESASINVSGEQHLPPSTVTVLRKPGVMDPVAISAGQAIAELGFGIETVRTFRRFVFDPGTPAELLQFLAEKGLANEVIDQIVLGNLGSEHLAHGAGYELVKITVPMRGMNEEALGRLSKEGQLYLDLTEMRTIRDHFERLGRNPTDVELETIAQTWSEHCSHKTLRGKYEFEGNRSKAGLLTETIMHATRTLDRDWCVSVFSDNAGIIEFDERWNLCFKVETHNHPSAIEPYGGANTGIGGVIRDILGAGLGAKPICNTDVFCVASPDFPHEELPEGVLHPARVLRGIVAGVRDYGNRMGIPTVGGAVCFDERYLGNPLVFCGTVGLIPKEKSFGDPQPGDLIVTIGGRTGRDGIHGATFSSGELTTESEGVSGGAVQIGNAITEKKVLDVLLKARDAGLFRAVTDCGAGGFSSAVGEMGEKIGAHVKLENAPLKYSGLSYTEIWISESQERMVLAVPPDKWATLRRLAEGENVSAVVLGEFVPTGRLTLTYREETVGDLSMQFLHNGRPKLIRMASAQTPESLPLEVPEAADTDPGRVLKKILGSGNVCSKEWIIRQYDHEVGGGSVVKPLVGADDEGPSDAAVLTPVLGSKRGIAIACGINPRFGDLDPYRMAASAIDEAIRNVVAVGADPQRVALLDNFCWGNTERPEVFGSLCQAAFACRDIAIGYGAPFISGKDSLNNEFNVGSRRIVIPPTLLISAIGIVPDVWRCVTMDFKEPGNRLILVGLTREELGGSHFELVTGSTGGEVPRVETDLGNRIFTAIHQSIWAGWIRSCHDLSEGGLAVTVAEMAFAGGFGADIDLSNVPVQTDRSDITLLFSESNSRFLLEVAPESTGSVLDRLADLPHSVIGEVIGSQELNIRGLDGSKILAEPIADLKQAWQRPLAW